MLVADELFSSASVQLRRRRSSSPGSLHLASPGLLGAAVGVAASVLVVVGHPELVSLSSSSIPLCLSRVKPLSSIPSVPELTFLPPSRSLLFLPRHRLDCCYLLLTSGLIIVDCWEDRNGVVVEVHLQS